MTEETKAAVATEPTAMEKAIAGGYKEPEAITTEQRAKNVVAACEHAVKHNAPIALETIRELRDLLGVAEEVVEKVEEATAEKPAA